MAALRLNYRFYTAHGAVTPMGRLLDCIDNDTELVQAYEVWLASLTPGEFAEFTGKLEYHERMMARQGL